MVSKSCLSSLICLGMILFAGLVSITPPQHKQHGSWLQDWIFVRGACGIMYYAGRVWTKVSRVARPVMIRVWGSGFWV